MNVFTTFRYSPYVSLNRLWRGEGRSWFKRFKVLGLVRGRATAPVAAIEEPGRQVLSAPSLQLTYIAYHGYLVVGTSTHKGIDPSTLLSC